MAADKASSKLIGKLRQVWRGPVAQMGFGRAAPAKVPAFTLIVSLPCNDPELARAAVRGGADAVVLLLNQSFPDLNLVFGNFASEKEAIKKVAAAIGEVVWGVRSGGEGTLSNDDIGSLQALGADFIVAGADATPASLLSIEGIGKIITVGQDLSPYLLRTINEVAIDAIEVEVSSQETKAGPVSILDVMRYRQMADIVRQPVIINTQSRLRPADVSTLRHAGVQGLRLAVNAVGNQPTEIEKTTGDWRQAIDEAGGPLIRGRSFDVVLPQVTLPAATHEVEEPDEDR